MANKWTLDMTAMQEDFFADVVLIGIACPLPVYRFCWMINERLDMNFSREPDLDISMQLARQAVVYFPIYQCCLPVTGAKYLVYKLKQDNATLMPDARNLDYMWLVQSGTAQAEANEIIAHLRRMPEIQMSVILSLDKVKNLSNILI